MKTLICLSLAVASALAADPAIRVQSVPHDVLDDGIKPGLMPGVAGVGYDTGSQPPMPCINCYGAPSGSLVLPPTATIIAPYKESTLIFYSTVDTGNVSGPGTVSLQVTEASTGNVVSASANVTFTANATNVFAFYGSLPDGDGYKGLEKVVYTATIGDLTAKGTTYVWVLHHTPDS
jgi:hypothetical protein